MRIRTVLIAGLVFGGLLPLAGLTWLTYDHVMKRELADVSDRHLLLAKNLSAALSRYEKDVRAAVRSTVKSLRQGEVPNSADLMTTLNIDSVAVIDPVSWHVQAIYNVDGSEHALMSPIAARTLADQHQNHRGLQFTPVQSENGTNRIHVVGWIDSSFVIACVNTRYFQKLGSQIAFGQKGHAAIVDQTGRALSHPRSDWTENAKDMSSISAVRRMMRGETGVEQFYTPALKADVIAGLTSVRGPGWGVMIPQPVSELRDRALADLTPFLLGFGLLMLIAVLLTRLAIRSLARPLEGLTEELNRQIVKGIPAPISPLRNGRDILELVNVVEAYNCLASNIQRTTKHMAENAMLDPVTGIGNRSYFMENSAAQIGQRMALSRQGLLMFLDLDGFKEINDTRGHEFGDAVLKGFASQLYSTTKRFMDQNFRGIPGAPPIIGRIGGDEFAILLPLPDNTRNYEELGEQLRHSLPSSLTVDGTKIAFGVSAGGALYPDNGTQIEDLLRRADVALYKAKLNGKKCFCLYNRDHALGGKSEILQAVSQAIENNELVLHYQPKLCLKKGLVTGVEALVRWNHPRLGLMSPGMFLPAIQQTHMMTRLGEWAIERSIADMQMLDGQGHRLVVAINIGTEHFCEESFADMLKETCERLGFDPTRMQVEVTEDVADHTSEHIGNTVKRVQAAGFKVAIDDFGKGFSNLSRLAAFPADILKLDRSLTSDAELNERIHAVMCGAIKMAHALGSRVIVEGVETVEQMAMAQRAGADAVQGFYIAPPMDTGALTAWLDERGVNPQHEVFEKLRKAIAA